ncbi:MAG: HAMP domain-containing protein [Chloroflexi bacterium]|nr:HAMP domain-containing protein [Chloroflexota bacterium]
MAESLPATEADDQILALPAPAPSGLARLRRLPRRVYDLIQKIVAGTIAGKIIAPYILILFILAMVAVFVVSRLVSGSLDEQFTNKLLDRGKATNEAVVKVEGEQLQALRLMANTNGVAEAMIAKDVEQVRTFVYPLQVNARLDLCDLITTDGKMLLALRGDELGLDPESVIDVNLGKSAIVQKVLSGSTDDLGDKFTELFAVDWGTAFYTAAPVKTEDGKLAGVIVAGTTLERLLDRLSREAQASLTVYDRNGKVVATSLPIAEAVLAYQNGGPEPPNIDVDAAVVAQVVSDKPSLVSRPLTIVGRTYRELTGALVIRGVPTSPLGIAVRVTAIETALFASRDQLTMLFGGMMVVVLFMGVWLANLIVTPLRALVNANKVVQKGDLSVTLPIISKDETGLLTETFNEMVEGLRDREKLKSMFSAYVSQEVAEAVMRGEVRLGGEKRHVTVMMTDVRSFTTISEGVTPEQLVEMFNRYFEYMIDSIFEFEGILDKFIGDGIMIEFNAPLFQERHELRGVLTGLRMREMLAKFNEDQAELGLPPFAIGMGVHCGDAIMGNIGADGKKVEYTALGDTVNVSARLESATKEIGTDLCISADVYSYVRDYIDVGPRVGLALKGKTVPVYAYTVLGVKPGLTIGIDLVRMPIEEVRQLVYAAGGDLDSGEGALEAGAAAG